jgi:hypothetical protein
VSPYLHDLGTLALVETGTRLLQIGINPKGGLHLLKNLGKSIGHHSSDIDLLVLRTAGVPSCEPASGLDRYCSTLGYSFPVISASVMASGLDVSPSVLTIPEGQTIFRILSIFVTLSVQYSAGVGYTLHTQVESGSDRLAALPA